MADKIIYTYVVDHGINAPRVGINTEVNGGKVMAVCFDDALQQLEEMREFLEKLGDSTGCEQTNYAIQDFLN